MSARQGLRTSVQLRITATPIDQVDVDVLVLLMSRAADGAIQMHGDAIDQHATAQLQQQLRAVGVDASLGSLARLPAPPGYAARSVLCVGIDSRSVADARLDDGLRQPLSDALRSLSPSEHIGLIAPDPENLYPLALTAHLAMYAFEKYRHPGKSHRSSRRVEVCVPTSTPEHRRELKRAQALGDAVTWARDLVNEPPNILTPEALARQVMSVFAPLPVAVTVHDEYSLRNLGCVGTLAVGQGSSNPPTLLQLDYEPAGSVAEISFVGKGVTFDSGGISIKAAAGMDEMKSDMAGAAAVVAAVAAIARLRLPVTVRAFAPCAENMPGGRAQRPGDILQMADGTSVEVVNTDAEGRLLLADALILASRRPCEAIVDVATLTSAQMIALGTQTAAVFANDEQLLKEIVSSGEYAGESVWHMPIPGFAREALASKTADLTNVGGKWGAMLISAAFLREFVPGGQPWAHLDIAGPAFSTESPRGATPSGGTGFGVATLVELARRLAGSDNAPKTQVRSRAAHPPDERSSP